MAMDGEDIGPRVNCAAGRFGGWNIDIVDCVSRQFGDQFAIQIDLAIFIMVHAHRELPLGSRPEHKSATNPDVGRTPVGADDSPWSVGCAETSLTGRPTGIIKVR